MPKVSQYYVGYVNPYGFKIVEKRITTNGLRSDVHWMSECPHCKKVFRNRRVDEHSKCQCQKEEFKPRYSPGDKNKHGLEIVRLEKRDRWFVIYICPKCNKEAEVSVYKFDDLDACKCDLKRKLRQAQLDKLLADESLTR